MERWRDEGIEVWTDGGMGRIEKWRDGGMEG